ncbi:MAG: response regulator [Kiritimatiellae bacterium]|nr:response regulator [Kiritimatiellia bacterium]
MIEIKWDIRRSADIYRQIYDSRLKSWIAAGKIKPGETVVWKSGFSGWRKPEELEELIPWFRRRAIISAKKIRIGGQPQKVLIKSRIKDILIVDDEKDLRDLLSAALVSRQYNVTCAATMKDALRSIKRNLYDLIFLDLKLPDGDGMRLVPKIKKINPDTIINIISAYGNQETQTKATELGINRFIDKPFNEKDIIRSIKEL